MKTEDFERLKDVCEKEGFEIEIFGIHNEILKITPKHIWDGVEFVIPNHNSPCVKKPYKAVSFKNGFVQVYCPYSGDGSLAQLQLNEVDPSTEQAYVDQLKKEAKDRFGEIKEGDKFEGCGLLGMIEKYYTQEWGYDKKEDLLTYFGRVIYEKGKWAERVKERLSGEYVRYHILWPKEDGATLGYSFKGFANKEGVLPIDKLEDAGKFLAKQLESYLNLEKHETTGYGDVISIHLKVDNNKMHNFERIKDAVVKFAEELK